MEIFDNVKFGVELETCVHMLGQTYFMEQNIEPDIALNFVMNCAMSKLPQLKWGTGVYDSWNVVEDGSLRCKETKYCMVKGIYTENCSGLLFQGMEFVSPVLKGREGLKEFALFWYGFFMSNNMVHLVNSTQGLHVNLSHPDLDPMDFARLWVYYEPVIWQLIPERRRKQATQYAEPVRNMNRDFSIKYGAIHIHGLYENKRIEVRVQEGLFIFSEILTWILLLMHMVVQAILEKDREYNRFADQITELEDFFTMLKDTKLVAYYNEIYNQNKEPDWPSYIYNGKTEDIYSSVYSEKLFEDVKAEIKEEKKCEDMFVVKKDFYKHFNNYLLNEDNKKILYNLKNLNLDNEKFSIIMNYAAKNNVKEILSFVATQNIFFVFSQVVCEYCLRYDDFENFKKYFYKRERQTFQEQYNFIVNLGFRLNREKFIQYLMNVYIENSRDGEYVKEVREMIEYKDSNSPFVRGYHNMSYISGMDIFSYADGLSLGRHIDSIKKLYDEQEVYPGYDMIPWGGKEIIEWAVKSELFSEKENEDILEIIIQIQILEDVQACLENISDEVKTEAFYYSFIKYSCEKGNLEIFDYLTSFLPLENLAKHELKEIFEISIENGNIEIAKKVQENKWNLHQL